MCARPCRGGGGICLLSALDYHELTTFNPAEVYVAIPHAEKPRRIQYPPIKPFFFRERFYSPGIIQVPTKNGAIRVYNNREDDLRYVPLQA